MSEAYLTNWALGSQFGDRDHFHEVALHEARVATERRTVAVKPAATDSLISRIRQAFNRPVRVEPCDCAVAA